MTILNAAAALLAAEVTSDRREAAERAAASLDSGAARAKLVALRRRQDVPGRTGPPDGVS